MIQYKLFSPATSNSKHQISIFHVCLFKESVERNVSRVKVRQLCRYNSFITNDDKSKGSELPNLILFSKNIIQLHFVKEAANVCFNFDKFCLFIASAAGRILAGKVINFQSPSARSDCAKSVDFSKFFFVFDFALADEKTKLLCCAIAYFILSKTSSGFIKMFCHHYANKSKKKNKTQYNHRKTFPIE